MDAVSPKKLVFYLFDLVPFFTCAFLQGFPFVQYIVFYNFICNNGIAKSRDKHWRITEKVNEFQNVAGLVASW